MELAPIALFAYDRPAHTRKTVEALRSNVLAAESELHIFSDGPRSAEVAPRVEAVRRYLKTVDGFRSIRIATREQNAGLSASIIAGVTELAESRGRVIVVEDDLVTSAFFLTYMNDALNVYEHEPAVISAHGYVYPHRSMLPDTFFLRGADCWGWATWKRGWGLFNPDAAALLDELRARKLTRDFNFKFHGFTSMLKAQASGHIDSWAIRWYASAFLLGKLTLYPGTSLVRNIGFDASGTHSRRPNRFFDVPIATDGVPVRRQALVEDRHARREFEKFFLRRRMQSYVSAAWYLVRHPNAIGESLNRRSTGARFGPAVSGADSVATKEL